jgi:hypothetical protein
MTEPNRWKRGDPDKRGWYAVRVFVLGGWKYSTDEWLGNNNKLVNGWMTGSHRGRLEHLPIRLESCLEPLP